MEKNTFGALILIFAGVIIALSLLPAIANNTSLMTNKLSVTDETINIATLRVLGLNISNGGTKTVTNVPSGWRVIECPLSDVTLTNASGTALTNYQDYNISLSTGVVTFYNTSAYWSMDSNTTLIDYTFCDTGYLTGASSRSIANLIIILTAVGLVGFCLFYVARLMKGE